MGTLARLVLSSSLLLSLPRCAWESGAPDLIEVRSMVPAEVGPGEQLQLGGRGFPEGKTATVVFRGTLHRAGRPPVDDVRVVARSRTSRANLVSVPMTQALHAEFCGNGEDAAHTTFRGTIVVAFSPKDRGAAPVQGSLDNVVVDLTAPPLREQDALRQAESAERMARALGIELEPHPAEGKLVLRRATGRAAEAGLLGGDELLELDGLVLRSPADLIPSSDGPYSQLLVRRPGPLEPFSCPLRVEGLTPVLAKNAPAAAVITILACLLLAGCFAPMSRILTWTAQSIRTRSAPDGSGQGSSGRPWMLLREALRASLLEAFCTKQSPLVRPLPFVLLASLAAAWTLLAFGGSLLGPGWDLLLLLLGPAALAVVNAIVRGGRPEQATGALSGRSWSLARGLGAGLRALLQHVPVLVAALCATSVIGSANLNAVVMDQGGWPHHWTVFRGPGALMAFLLLCASLVPELGPGDEELPEAIGGETRPREGGMGRIIEWLCVWVICGLCAALFLGGWALPWPTNGPASTVPGLLVGAAVFQTKCWLLVLWVAGSRWLWAHVRFEHMVGVWWHRVLPLSALAIVLSAAWLRLVCRGPLRASEPWIVITLFALTVGTLILFAHRVLTASTSRTTPQGLNPWL
jgi:NADH-quinone oxidoreductase subunit H